MQRVLSVIIGVSFFTVLHAQSGIRFEEAYSINPLSHNGVTCVHQDQLGFLWIGTFNGLNKYDGYSFRIFKFNENVSNTVSTNRIISIYEDRTGKLWIMTYDGGFHRFDPATEKFINFPDDSDSLVNMQYNGLYESESGVIALYSDKWGVTFITGDGSDESVKITRFISTGSDPSDLTNNNVSFVIQDDNRDFWIGTEDGLNRINEGDLDTKDPLIEKFFLADGKDPSSPVEFLNAARHDNRIWFGTKGSGLIGYNPEVRNFIDLDRYPELKLNGAREITALKSSGNILWIGTAEQKLIHYNSKTDLFSINRFDDPRSGRIINRIYPDNFDQVWLVTNLYGITRFDHSSDQFFYYRLTPPESNFTDDERIRILEDSRNRFWVGGQNMGIQQYDREQDRFIRYMNDQRDPNSLQSNVVECIEEDREGNIWIGTNWFGKGLSRLITIDPAFEYIRPVQYPDNINENVIRAIYVDSRGSTWTGTKNGQIFIYDREFRPVHRIDKNNSINYTGFNVYSIYEDKQGYIWLCTKGAGIYRSEQSVRNSNVSYSGLVFTSLHHEPDNINSLSNDNVYDLIVDEVGRIWVATYGGGINLIQQDENGAYQYTHFTTENSLLTSDKVRDLFLDSRGRLWIGTTYGLNYIDIYKNRQHGFELRNILSNPKQGNGLSYNDIIMIIEDRNGHIWLGTSGGGVNEILNPDSDQFDIKYYTVRSGLRDDYILSLTEDIYGFIWIGTNSGISRYNPVSGDIKNFDKNVGLPENFFAERTATTSPSGKVLFGTINGFYVIQSDRITELAQNPTICLTGFELNNRDISPGEPGSPLQKTITYSDRIMLKSYQSNFSIAFSLLSFDSPESNHYEYILEGFNDEWNYIGTDRKATFTNIPPGNYTFRVKGLNSDLTEYGTEASLGITVLPPVWKTKVAFLIYVFLLIGIILLAIRITTRFIRLKNEVKIEKRVAESKLRFFTNISHEIRTPLTLILGPLDKLISKQDLRGDIKQQLAMIHRNTKRLLRMVNQILDFRKVQNEQMTLKIQEIEVIPFLQQIYESFEAMARQKNIRFKLIHDPKDEHSVIWGDIQKLDIVFFNLLSNAFKFTPDNGQISIIVSFVSEPDESVKIVVRDSGIGIEQDKLDLIFNRFFVSHTVENDSYQGTGIGLSLSLEYISLHKGDIKAESAPGKGTDFTVRLLTGNGHFPDDVIVKKREAYSYTPKIHALEEVDEIPGPVKATESSMDNRYHIVIVEDDVEMCNYLNTMLESQYRVDIAKDGQDGWDMARDLSPDLIITDIMMPRMNGIELTRKLKNEFSTCHIPVIMLSSKSEVESQVEGLQTGAEAYVPKPFNVEIMLSYIQSFINQREKIKEIFNNRVELKPDEVQVTSKDKDFINNVIKMIDEHMSDPDFNVEKLASKVFISRTLFYKKIKGITGYQPVELIRMMRLKKAAQYIQTGEFNISEVAYMVGYNDIRYFSTSFKKQFGVSPSQFQPN